MHIHSLQAATAFPLANATGQATAGSSASSDPLQNTDNMFLQLLTAQLQNQSPIDPVDPTEFTAQLVQFNMLDQLAQINQTLQSAFSPFAGTVSAHASGLQPPPQGAH